MIQNWKFQRGDIFFTRFDNAIGSEQSGNRPAVVLQNDVGNFYSPTLIVATLTNLKFTALQKLGLDTYWQVCQVRSFNNNSITHLDLTRCIRCNLGGMSNHYNGHSLCMKLGKQIHNGQTIFMI